MLSRAAILSRQQARVLTGLSSKFATSPCTPDSPGEAKKSESKSELFQRPVRQEPGKVRLGFIPEEWFTFFYKKTGVTGPYTFGFTFITYLISKEHYVMEHEYYSGLSVALMCVLAAKYAGPGIAQSVDKEIDAYEAEWNQSRIDEKQNLEEAIADEEKNQWSLEGQGMLIQAKRENVALQLEASYRQRLLNAYTEVKKRLDYQVEKESIERRLAQKNLVDWVVKQVRASITPDQEKQNIDKCISDLAGLAKA